MSYFSFFVLILSVFASIFLVFYLLGRKCPVEKDLVIAQSKPGKIKETRYTSTFGTFYLTKSSVIFVTALHLSGGYWKPNRVRIWHLEKMKQLEYSNNKISFSYEETPVHWESLEANFLRMLLRLIS
jgi:hypothetical protein